MAGERVYEASYGLFCGGKMKEDEKQ